MKNTILILSAILLLAGLRLLASQTPAVNSAVPCNEQAADDKKKDVIDHDPLVDPADELRIRAQKRMEDRNFKELQEASTELAAISARMSREIDASGPYVISLRVLDDLNKIDKLTKRVRSRAK